MTHGNMNIKADKIELHQVAEADQFFAYGKPALFQQTSISNNENITAEALHFEYSSKTKKLNLRHNARLIKSGALFEGDNILYDTISETVNAEGKKDSSVIMIIPPKKNDP